jgi:hypothetical protein
MVAMMTGLDLGCGLKLCVWGTSVTTFHQSDLRSFVFSFLSLVGDTYTRTRTRTHEHANACTQAHTRTPGWHDTAVLFVPYSNKIPIPYSNKIYSDILLEYGIRKKNKKNETKFNPKPPYFGRIVRFE